MSQKGRSNALLIGQKLTLGNLLILYRIGLFTVSRNLAETAIGFVEIFAKK